jgi:four helix bundle protein
MYQSFEDLEVWKQSVRLAEDVYKALHNCKEYALRDQILRSAVSIPSNIAEGAERNSDRDFIRFLNIAKGSAAELRIQLYLAIRMELLVKANAEELIQEAKHVSARLHKLVQAIEKK